MSTSDKRSAQQRRNSRPWWGGLYRTTYLLGVAFRRTVDFVLFPYVIVANQLNRTDNRPATVATGTQPKKVLSRLSQLSSRLQSIEEMLSNRGMGEASEHRPGNRADPRARRDDDGRLDGAFSESLSDPDAELRKMALRNLGPGAEQDRELLVLESLHDPEPTVRCSAAAAAAETKSHAAVFSLILLLNDRQLEVRQQAKAAIENITGLELDFDPFADPSERKEKINWLQNWWKEERFARLSRELRIALERSRAGQ